MSDTKDSLQNDPISTSSNRSRFVSGIPDSSHFVAGVHDYLPVYPGAILSLFADDVLFHYS